MARISLLIFIAVVLAIGSVSAHPTKKTKKNLCPPTLSGLQTFPSIEINKHVQRKIKSSPHTTPFNTLFAICKGYSDDLAVFKVTAIKNVFGAVRAKYAMMTKAMFAAQVAVGVEGELAYRLGRSYDGMAEGFVELEDMIAKISASYNFDANAQISRVDRAKIERCLIKLKGAINVFVKVVSKCSVAFPSGKPLKMPGGALGAFYRKGLQFGGHLIGAQFAGAYGGQAEAGVGGSVGAGGQAGAGIGGNAGAGVDGQAEAGVGGSAGVGGLVGGKVGGRAGGKVGGRVGGKVGGSAGAGVGIGGSAGAGVGGLVGGKVGGRAGAGGLVGGKVGGRVGGKVGGRVGGKAGGKVGGQVGAKLGANGEAKVGGDAKAGCGPTAGAKVGGQAGGNAEAKLKIGGQAGGFFGGSAGFGGRVQYDAAGKAHMGGGSEFKPLSQTRNMHLD